MASLLLLTLLLLPPSQQLLVSCTALLLPPLPPAIAAGRIQESLRLFQQATALNPHNVLNLKQVPPLRLKPAPSRPARALRRAAAPGLPGRRPAPRSRRPSQVGRSLALLGKHRQAVDVYQEAQKLSPDDWELWYSRGLCLSHLKDQQDS
jgi:Bardet-Biedl syndrome 4 protein